jgi:ADP-ribosyl-[dinitrogen reductase] hydrolase
LNFSKDQILDRARGALLGTAVADALGAGYEFHPPLAKDIPVVFKASGEFDLGQYTDDTAQTIAVALAASRSDLRENLDEVSKELHRWYVEDAAGIGIQTNAIFQKVSNFSTAEELLDESQIFVATHEKAAGNGSLMRTATVALPYLSDPDAVGEVASSVSALTHADLSCREACMIWSKAIRHAILFENFDGIQLAINDLPSFRQTFWNDLFDEADAAQDASAFTNNGWVIHAIQAAYKAIMSTATETSEHLVLGIEAAVRAGNDTDTVAAIAGGLLGARWGYSAIPKQWLEPLHGWPGYKAEHLVDLADQITEQIWL